MSTKKITKRILLVLLALLIGYGVYYCWFAFPIISGYSAKNAKNGMEKRIHGIS